MMIDKSYKTDFFDYLDKIINYSRDRRIKYALKERL